jgi:hypothetical protein
MKTLSPRVSLCLSVVVAALVCTSASSAVVAAGGQGFHRTRNGFLMPIYGVSQVRDASGNVTAECATLTSDQVDAARFDRQVSRAMMEVSPRAVVQGPEGGATFNITYTDAEGAGFNDAAAGATRRGAFEAAVAAWAKVIKAPHPIAIQASMREMDDGDNNPNTFLLATAGPTEFWLVEGKALPSALAWQKLGSRYENAKDSDITVNVNELALWDYALNGVAASGKFSFVYTLMHEMAHGLGIVDSFNFATGKLANDPIPFVYDRFVNKGQDAVNLVMNHAPDEARGDLQSNDLFFNGASAIAASQLSIRPLPMVKLYAPDPYRARSSVGHLDQDTYADVKTGLMVPRGFGSGSDLIDSLTLAIMKDLGYELVPEAVTARTRQ